MSNSNDFRGGDNLIQYQGHLAMQLTRRSDQNRFRKYSSPSTKPYSVPTWDSDLQRLHAVMHENVEPDKRINFDIIKRCIKKLKPHKDDGNHEFKSDHIINGSNKLLLLLSVMFKAMLTHGFYP